MSQTAIAGVRIAGVATCVPPQVVDNTELGRDFGNTEVRKVIAMAGVKRRPVAEAHVTASDLCFEAAENLIASLEWERDSISAVIVVTQSPDYTLPSSACMVHRWMGLGTHCAAFDIGLGCSSYPYGLYVAATMLRAGGHRRILMLNGDTASRFASPDDHATVLLFSDAGSATAIELTDATAPTFFSLHTDGSGSDALIVRGGACRTPVPPDPRDAFVRMDGAAVFAFTIKRVPALIRDTLSFAGLETSDIDCYAFHQSNQFMMKHLAKQCGLPADRVPIVLDDFGNCGGASVAVTLTQTLAHPAPKTRKVMMLGYGVGLSWGAAIADFDPGTAVLHSTYTGAFARA